MTARGSACEPGCAKPAKFREPKKQKGNEKTIRENPIEIDAIEARWKEPVSAVRASAEGKRGK